ncbi:MAG: HAD hydrolase family protein [Clostridiales bacterium]|nr:HAD hydrolase family protein [Clostridiales bacterium]
MPTLYVSDLDGTLLRPDAALSAFSRNTVNRLVADGMAFTLATARSIASARPAVAGLKLRLPAVMMNGVFLTDIVTERHASVAYIPAHTARRTVETFLAHGRPPFVYTCPDRSGVDVVYTRLRSAYEEAFVAERQTRYRSFRQAADYAVGDSTVYINGIDTPDVILPLYEAVRRIPGLDAVCYPDNYDSRYYFLETFSQEAGKWKGIRRLADAYGFDRIVALGDNLNDLEMLRRAHVGVAVANAQPQVLQAADKIIGSNQEDGVAHFLLEEAAKGEPAGFM